MITITSTPRSPPRSVPTFKGGKNHLSPSEHAVSPQFLDHREDYAETSLSSVLTSRRVNDGRALVALCGCGHLSPLLSAFVLFQFTHLPSVLAGSWDPGLAWSLWMHLTSYCSLLISTNATHFLLVWPEAREHWMVGWCYHLSSHYVPCFPFFPLFACTTIPCSNASITRSLSLTCSSSK